MGRKAPNTYERPTEAVLSPKTHNQDALISAIKHNPIVIGIAPAGCGKTYVSAAMAARFFLQNYVDQIILSRANIPTGRTLGHFPGTIEEKLAPWLAPALDVLQRFLGEGKFKYLIAKRQLQLQPLETIRGRSFERSFIIVDEAQNLTKEEMIAITTRLGEDSKLVLLGDPFQTDIKGEENGLVWFAKFAERNNLNIPCIKFTLDDIVRNKIVQDILVALYSEIKN